MLSVVYVFTSYITKGLSKLVLLSLDTIYFLITIYLSDVPVLGFFMYPLFISYLEKNKYLIGFIASTLAVSVFSFYVSLYVEFHMLFIWALFMVSLSLLKLDMAKFLKVISEKNEVIKQQLTEIANLKNKTLPVKIEKLSAINKNDDKTKVIYLLNQILNTSSVVYFDFKKQKCIHTGNQDCDKSLLKFVEEDFGEFSYEDKAVIYIVSYNQGEIEGVFFFFYDDESLIDNLYNLLFLKEKFGN